MKLIDIEQPIPELQTLIALAQPEDLVLKRNGHALARLERFTDADLADWQFEHDPQVIRQADAARRRFERGEGMTLEQVRAALGLRRSRQRSRRRPPKRPKE